MNSKLVHDLWQTSVIARPRYFPRQLMTSVEMTLEQWCFLDKLRRHNRLLHGWGIVCGCRVRPHKVQDEEGNLVEVPWTVEIEKGYVLGPYGNEIVIPQGVIYDAKKDTLNGQAAIYAGTGSDPWCAKRPSEQQFEATFYIAIRYEECTARPVRVQPVGCGCDNLDYEYSRIHESFVIKALDHLPNEQFHTKQPAPPLLACTESKACPPCPSDLEPWVVLAHITPDPEGHFEIDCYTHRRHVVSVAEYAVFCEPVDEIKLVAETGDRVWLHLDSGGIQTLEEVHGGSLGAAIELPASALRGLRLGSPVAKKLEDVTVGKLAAMSFERYQEFLKERLEGEQLPRGFQPKELWLRAREVERLTRPYRIK